MSPKPESYFGITNEEEFSSLPPEDCSVLLKDRPNHIFFHPKHFILMNGPRTKEASSFAATLIKELNERHDEVQDDEQAKCAVEQEKKDVGTLLAFLCGRQLPELSLQSSLTMPQKIISSTRGVRRSAPRSVEALELI
jgi:hypothetical protein